MADTTYSVIVDLSTRGSLATPVNSALAATQKLDSSLATARSTVGDLASSMSGAFTGAVESMGRLAGAAAMGGLAAVVGAATYGVVGLNSELEKSTMSLAAIFNANGATSSIAGGMTLAADMMTRMRKDAAALPGEFSDLLGIFKMVQIPGLRAGSNPEDLEKFSANVMAAGASAGLDMHMVAREAGQLMSGRAGSHNVLGSTLFGLTGDEAARFNAQSGEKRLAELSEKMGAYQAAIGLFSTSFDALSSSLKDNVKKVLVDSTAPLFEKAKGELMKINNWFDSNEDLVSFWSGRIGDGLATAFDWGIQKITEWWPAVQKFAVDAYGEIVSVWDRIEPVVARVAEHIKSALSDKSAIGMIENVLKLYAAVSVGGSIGSGLGGIKGMSAMANVAGASLGEGGLAISVGGVAAAAGVAAVGMIAVAGALDVLSDKSAIGHETVSFMSGMIGDNMDQVGRSMGELANTAIDVLGPAIKITVDALGITLVSGLTTMSEVASFAAGHIDIVGESLATVVPVFGSLLTVLSLFGDHENGDIRHGMEKTRELGLSFNHLTKAKPSAKTGAGAGGGGTVVHKVEINVASNQDPARIAKFTFDAFDKMKRNPTSAPGVRNWSQP